MVFMKNKKMFYYSMLFLVTFAATIVVRTVSPHLFYHALVKSSYVPEAGFSTDMKYNFTKDGCYAISLVGKSDELKFYFTECKDKIEFFDSNGALIDEVNITKNRLSSVNKSRKILDMYVFEIPYKGKYRNLNIRYTTIEPDPVLLALKEKLVLYVNPSIFSCGEVYQRELLDKERNLNLKKYGIKDYEETDPTYVDLFNALKNRDLELVKQVLQTHKMALNVKLSGNREPVHYAAYFNDAETLTYLIEHGVDLNPIDISGFTPIQYAIGNKAAEAVLLLFDGGVDVNSVGDVPNMLSGYRDDYELSNVLFYTAIICSCELMQILLDKGVDISKESVFFGKKINVVDVLNRGRCTYGPRSNITLVTEQKYKEMRKLLIANGAKETPVKFNPIHIGNKEK